MKNKKSSYEGLQKNVRLLKLPKIEVWQNKYSDKNYIIHLETNEFTCICPKTSLPDFGVIIIDYTPDRLCVELKSFKVYLYAFRNIGIFHEHVTNRILDDFVFAAKPKFAKIKVEFNLRGGIKTIVDREYKK